MMLQRPLMSQSQRMAMNPQMIQSIKMMELPVMDLREKIEEELEKNPALEILEDVSTVSINSTENFLDKKINHEEDGFFENSSDPGFSGKNVNTLSVERQKFIEGTISHPETLQEHLLWQLSLEALDEKTRSISELLIQNLDSDGFHMVPVDQLLSGADRDIIDKALQMVQSLDPAGTCTADYMESLSVQIEFLPHAPAGIKEALSHLDILERGKYHEAAKKMACSEEEAREFFARIKELSPFPGRSFSREQTGYVVPDVQVLRKEGEFVIILNEEEIPVLGINPFFMKVAKKSDNGGKPVRDFARENIKEARWFINAINQRNHTLLRVSRAIVEFQRSFFASGPKYLAPLSLKDIADELGLHKATISRATHGKYMQTEWGIFELKYFFSNSISGSGSSVSGFSREAVKESIREIIDEERMKGGGGDDNPVHLSDNAITDLLAKKGIKLARRTVAKYRSELGLDSSFFRQNRL